MAGRILSRGFAAGMGFLGSVLWANCFAKETYGRYQFIVASMAVVGSFCLTGMDDAALISSAKKKDGNLSNIIRWRVFAAAIGALVIAGWGVVRYQTSDVVLMSAFLVTALTFVPIQLQPIWEAFTNGKRKFRRLIAGEVLVAVAGVVGVALFALFGWTGPSMLPWVMLTSLGLTALVALSLTMTLPRLKENDDRDPSIIRYGYHVTAAGLLGWVMKSDRLIVGEVMSASDVALLSIALVLPNQVKVFFTAFEQVFVPKVTSAPSVSAAWEYIRPRISRLWAAYSALGIIGFFMLPIVIPMFFSTQYVEAVSYARWLWLSLCLASPFSFLAVILNSQRDKRFLYIKNLASPAITLLMFAVLIPRFGLAGAVGARVATHGMLTILNVVYFAYAVRADRSASA